MTKISKKQAIENIKSAGATGDKLAMVRIYTENRIGYVAALQAYAEGVRQRLSVEG